jgi:hypothetical protein
MVTIPDMITWKRMPTSTRMLKARRNRDPILHGGTTEQGVREVYSEYIPLVTPRNTFPRTNRVYTIVVASTFTVDCVYRVASVVERRQIVMQGL